MPSGSSPNRPTFYAQEKPNACAVACLRMIMSGFGTVVTEDELALRAKTAEFGTEMGNLVLAAQGLGYLCDAGVFDLESLRKARFPLVFLDGYTLGRNFPMHAVVVDEIDGVVRVFDPARGIVNIPIELFQQAWGLAGSYALVLSRK